MTYNQQKKFTTVNGAICTIISGLLLLYLVGVEITNYLVDPNFIHSKLTITLDLFNPEAYTVDPQQMLIMTQLVDVTGEVTAAEMDQYFGGVYIQQERTYNDEGGYEYKNTYNLPTLCSDLQLEII